LLKQLKNWFVLFIGLSLWLSVSGRTLDQVGEISYAKLPKEAQHTMLLIKQGGPFPYTQDGKTFGNYEGHLPRHKRGYYREFTVKIPGARNRGAKRIVAGGRPPEPLEYYYTEDHYATFKRIRE
jgi:ribonuclease T1